jgi:hypothetical protein
MRETKTAELQTTPSRPIELRGMREVAIMTFETFVSPVDYDRLTALFLHGSFNLFLCSFLSTTNITLAQAVYVSTVTVDH